ncbi:MAG: ABC transporter permease subunit [Oscillospiraceae bacterium]|nr:ABC transporter permease subunit [Oscillospiraceae bacterium]
MRAVLKHELSSYFTNLSGYVFGAFLLLFAGIYTMVYNIQSATTKFEYVLGGMSFVFLVIVPILTMRVLAEERHQKTDQLLYSLPLTMTQVVLGKYFAMLVIFLVPLAIISIYPIVLTAFGNVYLPAAFSAIVGFFFLGAALITIGMYISSVTESQAVAAGLCFVVMLLNYFIADLADMASTTAFGSLAVLMVVSLVVSGIVYLMTKNGFAALMCAAVLVGGTMLAYTFHSSAFEGLFPEIMENLSLFEQFYELINGVFDLRNIVYFVSVIGVFLFLSVQSMEKRRWSE